MRIRGGKKFMISEKSTWFLLEGDYATSHKTQHSKPCFASRSLLKTPAPTSMNRDSSFKELCKGAPDHYFMLIVVDSRYRKSFWNGSILIFKVNLNIFISSYSGPTTIHKLSFVAILVHILLLPAESLDSLMNSSNPENFPRTNLRICRADPLGGEKKSAFVSLSFFAKLILRA